MKMKMRKTLIASFLISLALSSSAVFATSLQDNISAVASAESQAKAEAQKQQDAEKAKLLKKQRAEEQRRAKAAAARAAAQAQIASEKHADKKRDQNYEDELRQLELQRQKLQIERESARVKRENEFIDQDLKQQAAATDVIQSHADATRNLSEGGKDLMQSEGKAAEKKAGKWFGN